MEVIDQGTKTAVALTDLVVAPAQLVAAVARVSGSFVGVPELECVVDELAVLAQGADHGMIEE
jgi:hypothetical protein